MSYSDQNPAWDRMKKGEHDARIQWEAAHAAELQSKNPGLSRADALKMAAVDYAAGPQRQGNHPKRHSLGTKVMITEATLQHIHNGNRSIHAFPSDSYLAKAQEICEKKLVGEVTQLFPPGYEVNVTFSNGTILQVKDHWIEPVEDAPAASTESSPTP